MNFQPNGLEAKDYYCKYGDRMPRPLASRARRDFGGFVNMNLEIKEKLIEIVRKYECIYNLRHKDYKNVTYKSLLWEQIGASIGIPGSEAKDMWRTLRDGYIRYKKTVKGQTGSSRKYSNYTWSSQMSFLDGSLELRPTGSNISPSQESLEPPQSQLPKPIQSPPSSSTESPLLSPPSPETQLQESQPQPSTSSSPLPSSTPHTTRRETELQESQRPPSTSSSPLPTPTPRTTRRKNDNDTGTDNTERVLDYLRNKKKREWDSLDHLFMSYAKSFKQLSVRNQGKVKVALANMFAEAELDELENNASNEPNTQPSSPAPVIYLSPAYSVISDDSGEQKQNFVCEFDLSDEASGVVDLSRSHNTNQSISKLN